MSVPKFIMSNMTGVSAPSSHAEWGVVISLTPTSAMRAVIMIVSDAVQLIVFVTVT